MSIASNIRKLSPQDASILVTLRRQALENDPLAFGASPADDRGLSVEFVRGALADGDQAVFGHCDGPTLTGMVGVMRAAGLKRRHRAYIWGMYVAPEARAKGVGRQLLDAAVAHARTWPEVRQVSLSVTDVAAAARRLYERAGFRSWGQEPGALEWAGRCVDEIHLVLELREPRIASSE